MVFGTSSNGMGRTAAMMEQGLQATVLRRSLIANNIANVNTPGYKRAELTFESQLRRAVASEVPPKMPTKMTDDRHISFNRKIDFTTVQPRINVEYDTTYRNDGNNVDIDRESADAMKNSLHYNLMLEIYNRNIRLIDTALR
ncbi:MAG: flagellar basal body rod protein FlgB [Brevinema sp.]